MQLLFQICFMHGYFADGKLHDFQVIADYPTAQLIARYRLVSQQQDGVFSLYAEREGPEFIEYLRDQAPSGQLQFFLKCDRAAFFFATDLPLDQLGMLAFSSARVESKTSHQRTMLSAWHEGARAAECGVAAITLRLNDLLPISLGKRFIIDFKAREVGWQYCLINRSAVLLKNPAVIGNNGCVLDGPQSGLSPGGEKALIFSSGLSQFAVQQAPQLTFDLVDRLTVQPEGQVVEHCYIKGLPAPRLDKMSAVRGDNPVQVICTMSIYL
ncbi:hypothetical protein [Pseudomonas syringae]|uniref:hypothetical protein n=1 Tax=Pseudomonas syringae TaxID=317 RepID=UPI0003FB575D|nr:hypothetical protein [Pseudomonas syringae]